MAARDGGKRTRFACLETARGMVATTVSVLTVVVVVMVTIAALRPVEFSLSILHGMDSNPRWLQENSTSSSSSSAAASAATATTTPLLAAANVTSGGGGNSSSSWRIPEQVNLTFTLLAYNPSGRKEIRIFNFTVRVLEMPNFPGFDGMRDIAAFPVPVRQHFNLKRQGRHYLPRKFPLRDAGTLSYVASKYGAAGTFNAMVLVNASVPESSAPSGNVTYYCWPVLVGWSANWDTPSDGVTCTPRKELSIDVDSMLPQPAPELMAPALMMTPAAG